MREHGDIEDLKQSIKEVGLICPITINKDGELIAGRRRFQALKELGWEKAPIYLLDGLDSLREMLATLHENIKRKPLTDPELSAKIKQYHELRQGQKGKARRQVKTLKQYQDTEMPQCGISDGHSQEDTARELGISRQALNKSLQIAQAVEERPDLATKTGKEIMREIKRKNVEDFSKLPDKKYRVLYADPPWKYGDKLTADYGSTKYHYPDMSLTELCELDIKTICEENAVLFLWVTSPMLPDAFPVIKEWGFEYKTSFVWDKVKHNYGHYNSVRHEFLLLATRGSCLPDINKLMDSVVSIDRSDTHSQKPEAFRSIIDTLYPHGKRIELFARQRTEGWDTYGNEL